MTINSLNFDAQELREKILDLAMRGKLVKQDPNDEPASVLLEKITKEKEQLIKEKKIKKTKSLPEITDEEKPFDIPDSWEWVRLGDVAIFKNGKTPKKEDISHDDIYPYFKVKDMNNNSLFMQIIENYVGEKYKSQIFPKNTIIYPKNGGAVLTSKKRILIQDSLVDLNTGGLIPYKNIDFKFLFYLFQSFDIKKYVKGSAVPTIDAKKLKETIVPLPPIEEQSRIADKITQLFALLRKVESTNNQYVKLKELLQNKVFDLAMQGKLVEQRDDEEPASVLLEKIRVEKAELIKEKKIKKTKPLPEITNEEKPFNIPDSWEWVRLGDLVDNSISYPMADGPFGSNLKKEHYTSKPEVRIIQLSNIGEKGWKNENTKYTTFQHLKEIERSAVRPGDIVITKMMPAGRAIEVPDQDKRYVLSSDTVKFVPNRNIYKEFILRSINSPVFQKQVNAHLQGSTRSRTSLKKLKNYLLSVPPLKEQKRILDKINEIRSIMN